MSAPVYKIEGMGKRIKEIREKQGYKQGDLAERTGIGRSSIGSYEIGNETPPYANLIKIAQALNVSTDYLLGYESDKYLDLSGMDEKQREHIQELYDALIASA